MSLSFKCVYNKRSCPPLTLDSIISIMWYANRNACKQLHHVQNHPYVYIYLRPSQRIVNTFILNVV